MSRAGHPAAQPARGLLADSDFAAQWRQGGAVIARCRVCSQLMHAINDPALLADDEPICTACPTCDRIGS